MNSRAERALTRALERGDRPERRRREPDATPVPGLTLTPQNVVALQPAIGNAAVARVIARLKADHRAPVQELRKALAVLEDTVSALLANQRPTTWACRTTPSSDRPSSRTSSGARGSR